MTTNTQQDALISRARAARGHAYAPYSGFLVGAALLATSGRVYTGANIECASLGGTLCAERAALAAAITAGERRVVLLAVAGGDRPLTPCGICRQVLNEFSDNMRVICGQYGQDFEVVPLAELLPHSFGPEHLGVQEDSDGK